MNKDYILNGKGKIKDCDSNIARMNVLEYIVFRKFHIFGIYSNLIECADEIRKGIFGLLALLFNLAVIILFPISFPIEAYVSIRQARKVVERAKGWRNE